MSDLDPVTVRFLKDLSDIAPIVIFYCLAIVIGGLFVWRANKH